MIQVDPHALGPLTPEDAVATGPEGLFRGAERYLSARQIARATALRELVAARVEALLEPGERVLYLARGHQVPPLWDQLGFGALAYAYHTVALVVTDRRLLEVMLGYSGKRLGTRTRSFAWGQVASVTIGWRGLVVTSQAGKRHRFKVPLRGDRKVLGLLLPRITERLLGVPSLARACPAWHCPECAAEIETGARRCEGCGTAFRSKAVATWLALALPGGGLYYAGHPVLGTLDLLGELVLFGVVVMAAAEAASPAEMIGVYGLAAVFFVLTKSESIHLSRILVHRTRPVTEAAAGGWRRLAAVGAVVSVAAVLALPAVRGLAANPIDHDLVFADPAWEGRFERALWHRFEDEPLARSEWVNAEDWSINVLAEPMARGQRVDEFVRDVAARRGDGQPPVTRLRLGALDAIRLHEPFLTDDGVRAISLRYYVLDHEGRDAHLVFWNVRADAQEEAEALLERLIATGSFGPPRAEPVGTMASAR